MVICQHLGQSIGVQQTAFGMEPNFQCRHHAHDNVRAVDCLTCGNFFQRCDTVTPVEQALRASKEGKCPHPQGVIIDRYKREAGVADLYKGASCFLVLGGPSLRSQPLDLLRKRGVLIMSINNCPAGLPANLRPHIWLHSDPTGKFHDQIWRDPSILKFSSVRDWTTRGKADKKRGIFKRNDADELIQEDGLRAQDMPGILGFHRDSGFRPETWLWEPTINRGNDEEHSKGTLVAKGEKGYEKKKRQGKDLHEPNGFPHTLNTMLSAVRLAYYLGIKTLYLLGADFRMEPSQPYAFDQGKHDAGCVSNNNAYLNLCMMFDSLKPYFDDAGFQVLNCTPDSCLWTFDSVPFEEAIETVTQDFDEVLDAREYYDYSASPAK